jgi:hypothetical protein
MRSELETVAINTQSGFRDTRDSLARLVLASHPVSPEEAARQQ